MLSNKLGIDSRNPACCEKYGFAVPNFLTILDMHFAHLLS
jgi:hypothetical protein